MTAGLIIQPVSTPINEELVLPGDKSISHSALILAAIADGDSVIESALISQDTLATINALRDLGVNIDAPLENGDIIVHGVGKHGLKSPSHILNVGNSGTTMRLLAGLLAGHGVTAILEGDARVMQRPMACVVEPLNQMQALITCTEAGVAPLMIQRPRQRLKGLAYTLPLPSAQVKSALLLAGLYAEGETAITDPWETWDHTERLLAHFGYPVAYEDQTVRLAGGHRLTGTTVRVTSDFSSAAFFVVAAAMTPGSHLMIREIGINPRRIGLIHLLWEMGANITIENPRLEGCEPIADLSIQGTTLQGVTFSTKHMTAAIDDLPALFIAAGCARGKTVIKEPKELRFKASKRLTTMAKGLHALGIQIREEDDGWIIHGGNYQGGTVDTKGDHRVAMAFSMVGVVCAEPVIVLNTDRINTSLPHFLTVAKHCGLEIDALDTTALAESATDELFDCIQ